MQTEKGKGLDQYFKNFLKNNINIMTMADDPILIKYREALRAFEKEKRFINREILI